VRLLVFNLNTFVTMHGHMNVKNWRTSHLGEGTAAHILNLGRGAGDW